MRAYAALPATVKEFRKQYSEYSRVLSATAVNSHDGHSNDGAHTVRTVASANIQCERTCMRAPESLTG
jgi:hypothetical protein